MSTNIGIEPLYEDLFTAVQLIFYLQCSSEQGTLMPATHIVLFDSAATVDEEILAARSLNKAWFNALLTNRRKNFGVFTVFKNPDVNPEGSHKPRARDTETDPETGRRIRTKRKTIKKDRSRRKNKRAHSGLMSIIDRGGWKYADIKGRWTNSKGTFKENSVIVEGIPFSVVNRLGKQYKQDSFIYKYDGVLAMYFPSSRVVCFAMKGGKPSGVFRDRPEDAEKADFESKTRGGVQFYFDFDWTEYAWDGRSPVGLDQWEQLTDAAKHRTASIALVVSR